jgi:hypothetical protein
VGEQFLLFVVGVPLLLGSLLVALSLGRFEAALTGRLLDAAIPVPSSRYLFEGPLLARARGLVTDRTVWSTLVCLASKFFFDCVVVLDVPSVISGNLLTTPLYYDEPGVTVGIQLTEPVQLAPSLSVPWNELAVGIETVLRITSWQVDAVVEALGVSLVGLVAAVFVLNLSSGIARG